MLRNGETDGAESNANPNLVGWEDENDKENPMNWPEPKKWGMIVLLAFITFLTLAILFSKETDHELRYF